MSTTQSTPAPSAAPKTERSSWIDSDKARAKEGIVAFTFPGNGATREYNVLSLPGEMQLRLASHGAEQKLRDNVASAKKDGLSVSDVIGECDELWNQLAAGEWGSERTGGGESVSLLAAAIVRIRDRSAGTEKPVFAKLAGLDVEAVEKFLRENKTKEERKALRAHQEISIAMSEITLERKKQAAATATAGDLDI